jgi:hypothetical protein
MHGCPSRRPLLFAALIVLMTLITSRAASAQTGFYVSGGAFADIREIGSFDSTGRLFRSTDNSAIGSGGWFRAGGWLHPRWTLELGIDASSTTRVKTTDDVIIQIFPPPTGQFDLEATTKFTSATVAVGYHPPPMKKIRLGYLAGFSFIHARHTDEYLDSPSLTIGSDFSFGLTGSIGGIPTTPILRFTEATRVTTQNIGAFALGFEAAFDVADHVAVVSELRASTFSSAGGAGTFLIRPGVGVRWSF